MPSAFIRVLAAAICLAAFLPGTLRADDGNIVKLKKVVIDAGHGGVDPGCLSQDKKVREKDITLDVAKRVGKYISDGYPGVKVLYTRTKDVQVDLYDRPKFANDNDADLFISIHVNSAPNSPQASGTETFVMGTHKSEANMEVCKAENSVILLENDYKTRYSGFDPSDPESYIYMSLMQNAFFEQSLKLADDIQKSLAKGPVNVNRGIKQGGLLVLWRTAMPAVLVELGFISNASDRKVLTSEEGKDGLARRIFDAFGVFKAQYERTVDITPNVIRGDADSDRSQTVQADTGAPKPGVNPAAPATSAKTDISGKPAAAGIWAIQIFAVKKILKKGDATFRGVRNSVPYKDGKFYKYCVGKYASEADAKEDLPVLRKKFKDCFIVFVRDGKIYDSDEVK
jgi:N-acetylmuramoyl-L-alanine amidase